MITKNDATLLVKTIAKAAKCDIDQYCAVHYNGEKVTAIRGAVFRALDDIWYDVLSVKVRDQFYIPGSTFNSARECFLDIASEILNK